MRKRRSAFQVLAIVATTAVTVLTSTQAVMAAFIVDTSSSSITIGVQITAPLNVTLSAQTAGSNIVTFTPESYIDASVIGGDLVFSGGSIVAVTKPGPFQPGNISGNIAFTGSAAFGLAQIRAVGQGLVMGVGGTTALTGTNFDLGALEVGFDAGNLVYAVTGLVNESGNENIGGQSAALPAGVGTLIGDTLTIPISTNIVIQNDALTASVSLNGQIVAIYAVPEPASLSLLGVALSMTVLRRRRA